MDLKTIELSLLVTPLLIQARFLPVVWVPSHSSLSKGNAASPEPALGVNEVTSKAEEALNGKRNNIPPSLEYLALGNGTVALVHTFQVQNDAAGTWYAAHVDAHSGELLSVTDYVSHATVGVSSNPHVMGLI